MSVESYSFEPFFRQRNSVDYYADDSHLQELVRILAGTDAQRLNRELKEFSQKASFRWRDLADAGARVLTPWKLEGGRLVGAPEIQTLSNEVFAEGWFGSELSSLERAFKVLLVAENGETCLVCPLACTSGLVALLSEFADRPELDEILRQCREGAIGAQFLTEMHGGSDVAQNRVNAKREGKNHRIFGHKFFCSAIHADYALVTAREAETDQIGVFVVPLKENQGIILDRLKLKFGTRELPTAEVTFDGALGYAVGPIADGLKNVVRAVLTQSRLIVGLSSAAFMLRAAREARAYSEFRQAFGRPIAEFPMVRAQIDDMTIRANRASRTAVRLYVDFHDAKKGRSDLSPERAEFLLRELIMLFKIGSADDSTLLIRQAMSIFGGNGVVEDFSALPRLLRDSAVNELWEGPRNVLCAQIDRDLRKAKSWYPISEFVTDLAGTDNTLQDRARDWFSGPPLDQAPPKAALTWDRLCRKLYLAASR